MTDEQFKALFKRIEAAFNQEYTALQYEEWLDSFGGEDLGVAERAFCLMKDEFGYPPVVATFRSYIQRIKEEDKAKVNREQSLKEEKERPQRPRGNDHGWFRFTRWMLEKRNQWPKKGDDLEKLKAKFEREHPNWQPRKKSQPRRSVQGRGGNMSRLGNVMKDAMGNLERKEV